MTILPNRARKRFEWQTGNVFIAEAERHLLDSLNIEPDSTVLEIGSGAGSNLYTLRTLKEFFSFTGVDINETETLLAQGSFSDARLVIGDATNVPLPDDAFDVIFCRDLLHHVDEDRQKAVIEEMVRVVKPGGQVVVIESNGRNFVIKAFGRLVKSERRVLQSVPDRIEKLLRSMEELALLDPVPRYAEPNNLFRLLLHYHLGLPWLVKSRLVRSVLRSFNKLAARMVPPDRWAYMLFFGIKK